MRFAMLVAALCAATITTGSAVAEEWGGLTMKFVVTGKVPAPAKLDINKDQAYCGPNKLVDEKIVVGSGGELANVFVYLVPALGQKVPVNPELVKSLPNEVHLDNAKCRFEPHALVKTSSQKLVLGNKDPLGHNAKSDLFNNSFNQLIPGNGSVTEACPNNETVPGLVSCSIHPWMSARLLVRDDPYAAVSDKDGVVKIEKIPAGEWTFVAWHETGYVKGMQKGKDLGWKKGKLKVKITGDKVNDMGTIEIAADSLK